MQKKAPQFHWNEKSRKMVDDAHAVGIDIVKTHLTPFLQNLIRKHHYDRLEIACALLFLAYHALRKGKPQPAADSMFKVLAVKAIRYIEGIEPPPKLN